MKFFLALMALVLCMISVQAQNNWICSCFQPKYDWGCCAGLGDMMEDGNVCDIPRSNKTAMLEYEKRCAKIGGRHKCK